jgi:hypothetical protein
LTGTKSKIMDTRDILKKELNEMPENLLEELYDYMQYLKYKENMDKTETAYASESVLKKDWDNPEEDLAWKNL